MPCIRRIADRSCAFVASLPANDRIRIVQETYASALLLADGYNHELLKSEATILDPHVITATITRTEIKISIWPNPKIVRTVQ